MKKKNKKSGFTLIELIVVIAIIGILAAVITPRIRLSLYKARDAKAVATLDALRTASNVYFAEQGKAIKTGSGKLSGVEVKALIEAGYLDGKGGIVPSTLSNPVIIAVGTTATGTDPNAGGPALDCSTATIGNGGYLGILFDEDGVGMKFGSATGATATNITDLGSTIVDTNCIPWSTK